MFHIKINKPSGIKPPTKALTPFDLNSLVSPSSTQHDINQHDTFLPSLNHTSKLTFSSFHSNPFAHRHSELGSENSLAPTICVHTSTPRKASLSYQQYSIPVKPTSSLAAAKQHVRATQLRRWLRTQGKSWLLSFDDGARKQAKQYFESLKNGHTQTLDTQQLENLLVALGISTTKDQSIQIMKSMGFTRRQGITFSSFLLLLEHKTDQGLSIFDSFKKLFHSGRPLQQGLSLEMPIDITTNHIRRRHLLESLNRRI